MPMILILFISFFCASCSESGVRSQAVAEENISQDRYRITILIEKGMSEKQAFQLAREKAAHLTVEKKARYFVILKEQRVGVVLSKNTNQPGPNLYYELIQENDFSKENLSSKFPSEMKQAQGVRIEFQIFENDPGNMAIDACKLTDCS